MPSGWKRAMVAPMIPTIGTPKYITAAGLTSSAAWTKFIQTRTKAAASAIPTAAQYAILSLFLVTISYVRPAPKTKVSARTKPRKSQFHPSTKQFPSKGISRTIAVTNAGPFQRLLRRPPPPSVPPATDLPPCMFVFIGPLRGLIALHCKVT